MGAEGEEEPRLSGIPPFHPLSACFILPRTWRRCQGRREQPWVCSEESQEIDLFSPRFLSQSSLPLHYLQSYTLTASYFKQHSSLLADLTLVSPSCCQAIPLKYNFIQFKHFYMGLYTVPTLKEFTIQQKRHTFHDPFV